jgi:hypothetical protein
LRPLAVGAIFVADKPIGADFELDYGYGEGIAVDARTTAQITGIAGSTINVWASRGILPGVTVGEQGRARSFDANLVFHIAIMSVLVRLGYGAPFASVAAMEMHMKGRPDILGIKLIIGPSAIGQFGRVGGVQPINIAQAKTAADLDAEITRLFPEGRPEGLTIVDIDRIWARVRREIIEAGWTKKEQ